MVLAYLDSQQNNIGSKTLKMIKVKSSNIEAIGHDARRFQLFVEFKATDRSASKTFVYDDISPIEYETLINADSIGNYFSSIKAIKEGRLHENEPEPAKESSGWISVDDRLPSESGAYWTFNGLDERETVVQQRVNIYDSNHKQFYSHTVTHWMPLPEPPTT